MLKLAEENKMKVCIGRTHGQHALPTTYGMKFGIWADELHRQYVRLENAEANVCIGMMDGAVGTTAALGEQGWEIHKLVAEILAFRQQQLPTKLFKETTTLNSLAFWPILQVPWIKSD